jgi:hypothetical protein
VLSNVENYLWSSTSNYGFALQQGGILDSFAAAVPTQVHAKLASNAETIALDAQGRLYMLMSGGELEVSINSGYSWTKLKSDSESFGLATNGNLYDLVDGGGLYLSSNHGSTWYQMDGNTENFQVTPDNTVFNLLGGGILKSTSNSGNSWTTIDSQVLSFAVGANDTVYGLDGGGELWVEPAGSTQRQIDRNTEAFTASPNGTLYNLSTSGNLEYTSNNGSSWTTLDGNVQTFRVAANGALYVLDTGGALRLLSTIGGTWQSVDAGVQSFLLSANGIVFDLESGGLFKDQPWPGAAWSTINDQTQSIGLSPNGTFFHLDADGQLYTDAFGGSLTEQAKSVQSFAVTSNGMVYSLVTGGVLQDKVGPEGAWNQLDNICLSFGVNLNGDLYDLNPGGQLWELPPGGNWNQWDGGTGAFSLTMNGTIIDLDLSNLLWDLPFDGGWQTIASNVASYAVACNGTVYALTQGTLESSGATYGNWTRLDTTTTAFDVTSNGTIANTIGAAPEVSFNGGSSWFPFFSCELNDIGVADLAAAYYQRDGQLTRTDMLGLFNEVELEGSVTSAAYTSLRELVDSLAIVMPSSVRNLAGKVVNGDVANKDFQGQSLGDLGPGSSKAQLYNLVLKWFYGADLPTTDVNPATGADFGYALASGSLFGPFGVPRYNDVAQGDAADCYFMASLGQTALQSPKTIQSMITSNGDGTYTVRFFDNGVADYVTVNSELPVDSNGQFVYADQDQYGRTAYVSSGNNVLWAALVEKAYAQLAEEGWSRGVDGENSYNSIGYGWPTAATSQITGATTSRSIFLHGTGADPNAEQDVLNDINASHLITILTMATPPDGNSALLANHAYVLESYTAGEFFFVNPYEDAGARVVEVTWAQLLPYVSDFEDVTPPPWISTSSIVDNPHP